MKSRISLKTQHGGPDKLLLILPIILTIFGVVMVTNASVAQAESLFGDKFFFAKQQLVWAMVGLLGFFGAAQVPYNFWQKISLPLFWLTILLLVVVLLPEVGISALGARRWIEVEGFNFQPAELAKLAVVLYSATLLAKKPKVFTFLFSVFLVCGLILAQPALGTSVIIATTAAVLFFVSGAPMAFFALLLPVVAGIIFLFIWISPYRKERLLGFLAGIADPLLASYHVKQVILAIASGGLLGVGLGQSRQKFLFLPEATTDSIFAVMAEETGFLGSLVVILAFAFLVGRILFIARSIDDPFGKLVSVGVGTWIGIQAFINIAGVSATLPLTGVPLPFFSYGGSSLFVTLVALGIVANISTKRTVSR